MSDDKMVPIVIEAYGKTWELTDLWHPGPDREMWIVGSSLALKEAFEKFTPEGLDPQPRLLMVCRAFGEAFTGGPRDQKFESELFQFFVRNFGLTELAKMIGAGPEAVASAREIDNQRQIP